MVSDLLCQSDTHKSMTSDGIHARIKWEMLKELVKPLSITYQQSCLTGQVSSAWKLANATPIYKKGWKDYLGNYRPVSLTLVPGKVMEDHPECHYKAHAGQPGDQTQPTWTYERKALLDQRDLLA